MLLRKTGNTIEGINCKGLIAGIPALVHQEALTIEGDYLLDGEIIGDNYYVFDLLHGQQGSIMEQGYASRYDQLISLLQAYQQKQIKVIASFEDTVSKREYLEALPADKAEGVVLKALDAPYTPGRPASGGTQLKHKFYATASFVVAGTNKARRSGRIVLFDDVYQKEAGNVTIPPNHPIPTIGDVLDVRYLHAFKESGCIYQPVFLGRPDDVPFKDCTTKQLKF
ncbi:MAG: hypothetical protein ACO1QB_07435 [Verrucomicrobiales bacterium]